MSKNLNKKEWLEVIDEYKKNGIYSSQRLYSVLSGFTGSKKHSYKSLRARMNKTPKR